MADGVGIKLAPTPDFLQQEIVKRHKIEDKAHPVSQHDRQTKTEEQRDNEGEQQC